MRLGRRWICLGTPAFTPVPLERQAAEHGCFAGAGGGAADGAGGLRGVPKIGEHVDAALFDGRGLRVFILVDHVLVGGLVHDAADFGLDPGGAEGGEILPRVAVEDELIVDGLVDGLRVLLVYGELVGLILVVQDFGLELAGRAGFEFFGVVQGHGFSSLSASEVYWLKTVAGKKRW